MREGPTWEKKTESIRLPFEALEQMGAIVEPDVFGEKDTHILKFASGEAVTTIRVAFNDYTGADLVITNMTTLPDDQKARGLGSVAIQKLLAWCRKNDLKTIRAVQVQQQSEIFWTRNGFERLPDPNPSNDFQFLT